MSNHIVHNELNANFVKWWHACLGSPTINTLTQAIRLGALRNIERLTTKIIRQNPPHTIATAMGHLDNNRSGQNSTNPNKRRQDSANQVTESDSNIPECENDNRDEADINSDNAKASTIIYYDEQLYDYDNDEEVANSTYTSIVMYDEQQTYQDIRDNTIHNDGTGRFPDH